MEKTLTKLNFIDKLPEICVNLELVSVYDTQCMSIPEMLYLLKDRINGVICNMEHNDTVLNEKLKVVVDEIQALIDSGLDTIVSDKLNGWLADGTLEKLLNEKLFKDLDSRIEKNTENIGAVPPGLDIAVEINQLINDGVKVIKLPKGRFRITTPILLDTDVQIVGNKSCVLYTDLDIAMLSTKDKGNTSIDNVFLYGLNLRQEYVNTTSFPVIDGKNLNMARIERVYCSIANKSINSKPALKVYKTIKTAGHGGVYSVLVDKCDFRNSSVDINITDSYITNTNIWGLNREYALHLGRSSQQINNCQFVGGDTKGAVWIEDTDNGYDVEIIKINNCYFDGSYEDVNSGIGINAKKMRYSNITNCSIWYQKKDGMLLDGCFGNTFVGLTFEGNGKANQKTAAYPAGYADIKITGRTFDNVFSNITFACEKGSQAYQVKQKAIKAESVTTYEDHPNILSNLIVSDFNDYDANAFDFSFPYIGENIKGKTYKQNIMNGGIKTDTSVECKEIKAKSGFKTSLLFSADTITGTKTIWLKPNGQQKDTYLVCNNGSVLDIGFNVQNKLTQGSITMEIHRGDSGKVAEQTLDMSGGGSKYFKITNFDYGVNKIYKEDLLKVKLILNNVNNCDKITATVNISQ